MNIDASKSIKALGEYKGKMEFLTRQVHEHVLLSGYLETHNKKIIKGVDHIAECHDELLIATFIGKLRHKLPVLRMGIKLSEFDKKQAQIIAAALITQVYIDNGHFPVDKRLELIRGSMPKKFHTRQYMVLGGSFEKDLLKGIESKPGVVNQKEVNGWKLNAVEKKFLRTVSSIPFEVSDICTRELLMKGYSLKVDWDKTVDKNGRTLPEDPIVRKGRFKVYADTIIDKVMPMEAFYMPMKYCGRDRVYYEAARLDGIRPHGKEWELHMIDAAVPFDLTEVDERVLKHIIYVTLYGRVSIEYANEHISDIDILDAEMASPMQAETEEDFGIALRLNKAAAALMDYRAGRLSRSMFGYDFTNSGLLMSGVAFRSEEMMAAGNIAGSDQVVDSHTAFGDGLGLDLTRDEVKSIHMGLMHGSTMQSIADVVTEAIGQDTTEQEVSAFAVKSYGKPVLNIPRIADWGSIIVGNEQTDLRWTYPDGHSACSRAYLKSVPVMVYAISASHECGYTSHVVVSDMPWVEDKNGFPIYGKETVVGGITYKVEQKKRGLFAGITHGNDAYMLRAVGYAVLATGRPLLFKHDDFIAPPSAQPVVLSTTQDVFSDMYQHNFYQLAIDEIAANSPYNIDPLELELGIAPDTTFVSQNFLMP